MLKSIPLLSKKIKDTLFDKSLINNDNINYSPYEFKKTKSKWIKSLINLGFKIRSRSGQKILVHDKRKLVVKIMYTTMFSPPKNYIPTLLIQKIDSNYSVVVQPLVDISFKSKNAAFNYINSLSDDIKYRNFGIDAHLGNVGLYKNKPVVFDY
jgi:hypothetical protein